jgi:hypothetical protein
MTKEEIDSVGKTLIALYEKFEEVTIENCALKKVLRDCARPNESDAPPLPKQVLAQIPKEREQVKLMLAKVRGKMLESLAEGKLPELSDLTGSATKEAN